MMRQFRATMVIPAIAGIAMTIAGCGDAAGAASAMPTMPGLSVPAAAPGQDAPVATDTVAIQNFAFAPGTVTVKAGTTVTWTNQDQDPHTVSAMNGSFHSQTLSTGQSYRHTFTTPGRFDYLCTIHPFMTATVVVTP
ncbi:MAG TPA: cupredoxin family copper-binding protein [Pseudonocardiaceae bacterium]|nr:cupredoxin family copper-binding protein [Pseudonocardiaceae bacterium]